MTASKAGPHAAARQLAGRRDHGKTGTAEAASPDDAATHELRSGVVAHAAGDLLTAAEHYLRAHDADRESQAIRNNLGLLRMQQGDLDEADRWLSPLEAVSDPTATSLMNLGNLRATQGRMAEGLDLLERSVLVDPGGTAWVSLGQARMLTGDLSGAEVAFREASRQLEPRADVLELLGACLLHRGAVDDAVDVTTRSLDLDASRASAWQQLSAALLIRQDLGSAVNAASRSVALRPGDVGAIRQLATALVAAGRPADASQVLDEALSDRRSAVLLTDRAVLALADGLPSQAVTLLEELVHRSSRAELYLGLAYLALDRRRDAKATLRRVAEAGGPDGDRAAAVLADWPSPRKARP